MKFSVTQRSAILEKLQAERFDVLIIGGGITGVGIALDAASRGLKTALIEKNDFAFGTSSRSTKLIHGGLRYLKQLEFGLVKEVGSERAIVHKLAPHLVVPEKMLLPLAEKKGLGYWLTSIGLMIYDYLAGVKPADQRRMLTRKQTLRYEPLLRADDIKGGAVYAEYRTDDARLTIEIAKTAFRKGAVLLNYVEARDFVYTGNIVSGVVAVDHSTASQLQINAKVVVNAAGPWVDTLREINRSKEGKRLHLTKGVHIVVPRLKFPVKQSVYFDVDDGRMIFAIPRGEITYIGTTDTNYKGSIDDVLPTYDDAVYLIGAVNARFPTVNLGIDDIQSSWAGLRPLIHEEGKSASQLSRKDEIFESSSGLISIAGGKLTGYRKMAERVVNLVIKKHFHDKDFKKCFTSQIKITEPPFSGKKQVRRFVSSLQKTLMSFQLQPGTAQYLVENYGRQAEEVMRIFDGLKGQGSDDLHLLQAELVFSIENEMVCTLSDFFVRRTGLLYFNITRLKNYKNEIAGFMQKMLGWSSERCANDLQDLESLVTNATNFRRESEPKVSSRVDISSK